MKIISRVRFCRSFVLVIIVILAIVGCQRKNINPEDALASAKSGITYETLVQRLGEPMYLYKQPTFPVPLGNSLSNDQNGYSKGKYYLAAFLVREITPLFLVVRVKSDDGTIEDAKLEKS